MDRKGNRTVVCLTAALSAALFVGIAVTAGRIASARAAIAPNPSAPPAAAAVEPPALSCTAAESEPEPDGSPRLELVGEDPLVIPAGPFPFVDPGCTAWDVADGDITGRVAASPEVIPYRAGEGRVTYTVTDSAGRTASLTRRVTVGAVEPPETVEPEGKVIYLTFDDGPCANTPRLLDILDAHGVKATFFVTGRSEEYRWCIGEMAARGHSVGVHSASHDYYSIYQSEDAFFRDFRAMEEIIREETGAYTTLLRFPGGGSNTVSRYNPGIMTALARDVRDMGYQYFDWNVSSADTASDATYGTTVANIKKGVSNNRVSVVLQHDTNAFSVSAVEEILRWGLANGYSFRPLDPTSPTVHHTIAN